jgi:hypothetical protein
MENGLVDATNAPPFKEDDVAFRIFGIGTALQDERFFEAFSDCLARKSGWRGVKPTSVLHRNHLVRFLLGSPTIR